jgi:thiosulfate/3-mercaptopyruvate sulfurtransferase
VADGFPEGPLVDAEWLRAHLDDVRVVDVRWYLDGRSGHDAYLSGHIPGAVWADIDHDLSGPPAPLLGRHPLPSPAGFAAVMGRLGISNGHTVVAYDDASGSIAGRLWWMLDSIGVRAYVLDGGIDTWIGALDRDMPVTPEPVAFSPRAWPAARYADADEVDRQRRESSLLDARAFSRFTGDEPSVDAVPGHIPGARSAPWAENIDPETGRFLPADVLRRRFAALGVEDGSRAITSCGSGVTACHDLLALRLAGFENSALYAGSWSGWSSDPDRPVALGSE